MDIQAVGLDIGKSWFHFFGCNRAGKADLTSQVQSWSAHAIHSYRASSAWKHVRARSTLHVLSNVTATSCSPSIASASAWYAKDRLSSQIRAFLIEYGLAVKEGRARHFDENFRRCSRTKTMASDRMRQLIDRLRLHWKYLEVHQ